MECTSNLCRQVAIHTFLPTAVVASIEEARRKAEVSAKLADLRHRLQKLDPKLDLLTPTRQLLREDSFHDLESPRSNCLMRVFLCNDLIVFARPKFDTRNPTVPLLKFKFGVPVGAVVLHDNRTLLCFVAR